MAKVDVVTTTFRNTAKLKLCLESVTEKTKYVDYKWYVWCNSPNDEIKKIIHDSMHIDGIRFNDHVEPIFNDTNDGSFSSNNNEAAAEGNSEYILFLNDDISPLNDSWLLNMTNILDSNSKIGVVGSLLLYPDKQTIQHCGVFFSDKTNGLPYHMFYRQNAGGVKEFISKHRYYQAVTAACMLVRRDDFEKIGGFSEDFFYMYEDIGLCLDMKEKLNKRCLYNPQSVLVHHEGISGDGKNNPKFQENISVFRDKYSGKYYNDLEFYLNNKDFMVYKNLIQANK
jgi:GT2 family glycosyltransferase